MLRSTGNNNFFVWDRATQIPCYVSCVYCAAFPMFKGTMLIQQRHGDKRGIHCNTRNTPPGSWGLLTGSEHGQQLTLNTGATGTTM